MGKGEEERRLNVLLERIEQHYKVLSEKVMTLDQKIDRGLRDVRHDIEIGFGDMRMGITTLVKELREHSHTS